MGGKVVGKGVGGRRLGVDMKGWGGLVPAPAPPFISHARYLRRGVVGPLAVVREVLAAEMGRVALLHAALRIAVAEGAEGGGVHQLEGRGEAVRGRVAHALGVVRVVVKLRLVVAWCGQRKKRRIRHVD